MRCSLKFVFINAGIAQLVERNLAKVEVGSSRLLSRSRNPGEALCLPLLVSGRCTVQRITGAGWQSGYAAACKAVDAGSIPTPASSFFGKGGPRLPGW
jgi:hypothetical protein